MGTPHINANPGDFANIVLMPGDPVRAKWIADTFLTDYKQVTDIRGILGFTGHTKNGKRISVMASGMGQPSIGIYSYELFSGYGVDAIIRVGTMGSYQPDVKLFDVVCALSASTDSNWVAQYKLNGIYSAACDFDLAVAASEEARKKGMVFHGGNVLSADVFYDIAIISAQRFADSVKYGQGDNLIPPQLCHGVGSDCRRPAKVCRAHFLIN